MDKVFEVRCDCDRCGREHVRESNGDISPPPGWSYLHVSIYGNQREQALLCASCLALVLAAAAPARLDFDPYQKGAIELSLREEDRQLVLLALARLSVERPGWEDALHTLALQIDAQTEGRATMFDQFRATAEIQRKHEEGTP